MKVIIFAAALTFGGAAMAQTGNTVDDYSRASGPHGVTQQGTVPDGQPCVPPGYNANAGGYTTCTTPPEPAVPCTKTRKDRCVQTYERGVRRY